MKNAHRVLPVVKIARADLRWLDLQSTEPHAQAQIGLDHITRRSKAPRLNHPLLMLWAYSMERYLPALFGCFTQVYNSFVLMLILIWYR
jgi:hypothetical protein